MAGATPPSLPIRHAAEQLAAALPPLLVKADRVAASIVPGVHGRRRVGVGESFWQFRRYQAGDPAHRVDWRQSAKTDKLFVREHEWEAAQSIWLWRDHSASMDYGSGRDLTSKRERAELLLAALAVLLIRGGEHVGLYGADQTATGGRATLNRLVANLEAQAAVGPASEGLPAITRLPRFCHLVLIGDFLSPLAEVETTLRTFSTQGARGHLVQILDPAEEDLPFHGRTEFDGTENEGQLLVGRVESLRDAYVRRMAARRDALTTMTRQLGWTSTFHRTDRSPQTALLSIYGALGDLGT